jgi:membrane associated rhomboid family serine protease
MGGFLVTYPQDRIKTLVPLGFYITIKAIPASVLIGVWLLSQLLNEAGALVTTQSGGVAYVAHIAGAVFGMLSARRFESHHFGPRVSQWC